MISVTANNNMFTGGRVRFCTVMNFLCLIVLAAGRSRRFGDENKLLAAVPSLDRAGDSMDNSAGAPLLEASLGRFPSALFHRRLLVVGPHDNDIAAIGRQCGFEIAVNNTPESGMGSSIAAGVRACPPCDGVMIALGDMPLLKPATVETLAESFVASTGETVIAPVFNGQRGHPVIFPSLCFDALRGLDGDAGARRLIASGDTALLTLPVDDPGVLQDIDTPDDIDRLKRFSRM